MVKTASAAGNHIPQNSDNCVRGVFVADGPKKVKLFVCHQDKTNQVQELGKRAKRKTQGTGGLAA